MQCQILCQIAFSVASLRQGISQLKNGLRLAEKKLAADAAHEAGDFPLDDSCMITLVSFNTVLDPSLDDPSDLTSTDEINVYACAKFRGLPLSSTDPFEYVAVFPTATAAVLQACAVNPAGLAGIDIVRIRTTTEFLFTVETSEPGKRQLRNKNLTFSGTCKWGFTEMGDPKVDG